MKYLQATYTDNYKIWENLKNIYTNGETYHFHRLLDIFKHLSQSHSYVQVSEWVLSHPVLYKSLWSHGFNP